MDIYIPNKYTNTYYSIVNRSLRENRKRSDDRIYEEHHIIPKSCGGLDDGSNLVLLTPKEHYICHKLLTKMVRSRMHYEKMIYALWCMVNGNGHTSRYSPNGKTYHQIKEEQSIIRSTRMKGEGNHFFGKKHSDEFKQWFAENNPAKRDDVRQKMSDAAKAKYKNGYINHNAITGWSNATKEKLRQANIGKKLSDETRQKMSRTRSNKVWVKKEGEKSRHIQSEYLPTFLADGWCLGRHLTRRKL